MFIRNCTRNYTITYTNYEARDGSLSMIQLADHQITGWSAMYSERSKPVNIHPKGGVYKSQYITKGLKN